MDLIERLLDIITLTGLLKKTNTLQRSSKLGENLTKTIFMQILILNLKKK